MSSPPGGIADYLLYCLFNLPPGELEAADADYRAELLRMLRSMPGQEEAEPKLEDERTTAEERLEELHDKLKDLSRAVPNWLLVDRKAIVQKIVRQLFKQYRALPSPDSHASEETGLDFLARLVEEGGDNGLYEASMQQMDSEIYAAIETMHPENIVALLLPMEMGNLADLFRDGRAAEDWHNILMQDFDSWPKRMRHIVMNFVQLRHRIK